MAAAREVPGLSGRQRYGVIAMTPGNTKVALVRQQEDGAWQFPSLLPRREAVRLEDELEAALDAAEQQLGLDVASTMCSQPVIHVRAVFWAAVLLPLPPAADQRLCSPSCGNAVLGWCG